LKIKKLTIISLRSAGIGNCLFQYAAGLAFSIKNKTDFYIDLSEILQNQMPFNKKISYKEKLKLFQSSLERLIESYKILKKNQVIYYRGWGANQNILNLVLKKSRFYFSFFPRGYYNESFNNKISFFDKRNTYLDGLFIDWRYFQEYSEDIINSIKFKKISKNLLCFEKHLKNINSVSIHIRRGDYLDKKSVNKKYKIHGVKYVKKAIKIIESKISYPNYFIFSDDLNWCKSNLSFIEKKQFIDSKISDGPIDDLYLMSKCKNNIISNSTFSWWGAFLNRNKQKIVIIPKEWKSDQKVDLAMDKWIRLEY
tara:strand:- start:1321 stop:2250 length:930 start_codon:yes stop_codon:yes gene_type:complete